MQQNKSNRNRNFDMADMVYGKVPPQSRSLEEVVLGAIMLEKNALIKVYNILKPEHFYVDAHMRIYKAILSLESRSKPIDILMVVEELKSTGDLEIVGGPYYVNKLTNSVVSSANIVPHARIIQAQWIKRQMITICGNIVNDGFENTTDPFDMVEQLKADLYKVEYEIQHTYEQGIDEVAVEYIKERMDFDSGTRSGVKTGFREWDALNGFLEPGEIYTIGARPAMGKTSLAIELTKRISETTPMGFFSLEMRKKQIFQRCIGNKFKIPNWKFKQYGSGDEDFMAQLHEGVQWWVNLNLFLDDFQEATIEYIRGKVKYWVAKHGIKIIIIDFLQDVYFDEEKAKYMSDVQRINHIIRNLKIVLKEVGIPGILLSQLSREVEKRTGPKRPKMSDLKNSGNIEQSSYQVMLLHRPEYYGETVDEDGRDTRGLCYGYIDKFRDGAQKELKFKVDLQYFSFEEWEEEKIDVPGTWQKIELNFDGKDEGPF